MSLPRYPEYKDSGVEWLGIVPAHWTVAPVKRGYAVCLGKMLQPVQSGEDDVLAPYLRAANIQWGSTDTSDVRMMWFTPRDRQQLALRAGDLLISEGGDVGRSAIWRDEIDGCFIQNSVNRVRSTGEDSTSFLFYWMAAIKSAGYIDVLCNKSTIAHFTAEKVAGLPVPYPPGDEQRAIVDVLDRKVAKIDALIAEQEKLIALQAEKRQATITHAVTRGLNPGVPMTDSGVPWIGEVPAHWDVKRVKDVTRLESGHTPSKQVPEYWVDCHIPWVSLNDSKQLAKVDYITHTAVMINAKGLANSSARLLPAGSVVFTRDASIGLAAITTREMAVSQHLIAWCPTSAMEPLYLLRVFNCLKPHLDSLTEGATIKTIGMGEVKRLVAPVPPVKEQCEIAEYLETAIAAFRALIKEVETAIALLKERRSALITAAVTGQIDVRNAIKEETA